MARLQLLAPSAQDIEHIAANLRAADVQELRAVNGSGLNVLACLRTSVAVSEEAYVAVTAAGEPVALTGVSVVSLLGGLACPWLLGTDTLLHYPRDIVVQGKRLVARWETKYTELYNHVDARNSKSIAWLKHIGFTVPAPEPYGIDGLPFHRFLRCT